MSEPARRGMLGPGLGAIRRAGAGPCLIGIHGAGHAAESWDALFDAPPLASFDRLAVDLPGRHASAGPPAAEATEAARRVLASLTPANAPRPRVVLGHSFGGAVAIELALIEPAALDGLVLISTGARLRVLPERLELFARVARGEATRPRGAGFSDACPRESIDAFEDVMDAVPAASALADWLAADRFDRLADVPRITVPTLVVGGDADPFTPFRYTEFLASRIRGSTLVRVAGGSHLALVENAAEIAAAVRTFVDALPAA